MPKRTWNFDGTPWSDRGAPAKEAKKAPEPRSRLIQLKPEDVEEPSFLWSPYLLGNELCTLAGPKGAGKTWVSMDIASRVTRGTGFPGDDGAREPRNVIYGSREGKLRGGILRRCLAAGIDLARLAFMDRGWDMREMAALEASILEKQAALVILDPLTSYFPGSSAYSSPEARRITETLTDIANNTGCCILGVLHLTKDHRHARGSGEIENVARVNLQMGHCQRDDRQLFVQTKNSEVVNGVSRHYEVMPDSAGLEWQDEAPDEGPEDLLPRRRKDGAQQLATVFLLVTLADGEVLARVVLHRALKQGIHPKTLRRAATALGISQENGTIYRKGHREWWWRLPEAHQPEPPEILLLPSGL
jgi:hypothetical protein